MHAHLTLAEQTVVEHLSKGLVPKAIARLLHVSGSTVRTHVSHLHAKFGSGSVTELTIAAMRYMGRISEEPRDP